MCWRVVLCVVAGVAMATAMVPERQYCAVDAACEARCPPAAAPLGALARVAREPAQWRAWQSLRRSLGAAAEVERRTDAGRDACGDALAIECERFVDHADWRATGDNVTCALATGLVCHAPCASDYAIR